MDPVCFVSVGSPSHIIGQSKMVLDTLSNQVTTRIKHKTYSDFIAGASYLVLSATADRLENMAAL